MYKQLGMYKLSRLVEVFFFTGPKPFWEYLPAWGHKTTVSVKPCIIIISINIIIIINIIINIIIIIIVINVAITTIIVNSSSSNSSSRSSSRIIIIIIFFITSKKIPTRKNSPSSCPINFRLLHPRKGHTYRVQ